MAKHLLYLTNNQLTAAIWDNGALSDGQTFDNYASGWQKFSEYLAGYPDVAAFLLTDLIEEDFQRENIPHVLGLARQNLIQRRLANLYRDTPYREASHQGRAKEGRRDDQMLFSALTNAPLLKPWLEELQKQKIAVAGIYSVALLSPLLFKKLDLGKEPALLVTQQSSGLRQSYFQGGYLRFSRLTPETAWSPEAVAEIAESEMAKTRQFLASTRLMARGAAINIVVVADAEIIAHLRPLCPETGGMSYRFIDLNEARQVFGLKKLVDLKLCDRLFLSLLGSKRVASHYATFEQIRFHALSQVRAAFNFLSATTLAGALIWASGDGLDALRATNLARRARMETQETLARHQATLTSMPITVANPHDMKAAVDLEQMIAKNAPAPIPLLTLISRALDTLPQIKIHELNWQVSETDGAAPDASAAPPPPAAAGEAQPLSASLIGIPAKPFEIVTLEGEVVPFKNDYRTALESVHQMVAELQKDKQLKVEIIKPPLDVRPTVKLASEAGNDEALAKPLFSLKLVWKP